MYLPRRRRAAPARALPPRRGADRRRRAAELARRPPAGGRLLRGQGRARGAARRAATAWTLVPAQRAVPAPGPRGAASSPTAKPPAGSARSIRSSPRSGICDDTVAAFELDLDAVPESGRPRCTGEVSGFPDVREDLAVVVSETRERGRADRRRARRRRPAAGRRRGVRRLPRSRRGSARATCRWRCRLTYRATDRTLTDEEVAERREAIAAGGRATSWAGGSVPHSVSVFGSAGFTGALTARLLLPPSVARAPRAHRAQRHRAPARRPLPPPPRAARARGARPRPPRRRRRRGRRLPPRRRRAARGRAARAGRARGRPERRLPAARPRRCTERWYREHEAAGAARRGGVRPARAATASRSAAPSWSRTRAAIRPPRCSRSRRWRGRG